MAVVSEFCILPAGAFISILSSDASDELAAGTTGSNTSIDTSTQRLTVHFSGCAHGVCVAAHGHCAHTCSLHARCLTFGLSVV